MNSYKQSLYCGAIRILANLLMVCAIFLGMYQASRSPAWPSEVVFCAVFFGITIPVWLCAWRLSKWTRKRWPTEKQTYVALPRLGNQLVSWHLRDATPTLPLVTGSE